MEHLWWHPPQHKHAERPGEHSSLIRPSHWKDIDIGRTRMDQLLENMTSRCGAIALADGSVQWRVWASLADRVNLVLTDGDRRETRAMIREARGYYNFSKSDVPDGQRYAYSLNGGPERPDPASRWQPDGVNHASAVLRTDAFIWSDEGWTGLSREELVFYELHVGTFTPDGTFDAIIPRLPALRDLGVTAIELMPVGQFSGARNWGYDGVHPFAPQRAARMLPHPNSGPVLKLIRGGRRHDSGETIQVLFNLSAEPQRVPELNMATLLWTSESTQYDGTREASADNERMLPYECIMFAPSTRVHESLRRTKG